MGFFQGDCGGFSSGGCCDDASGALYSDCHERYPMVKSCSGSDCGQYGYQGSDCYNNYYGNSMSGFGMGRGSLGLGIAAMALGSVFGAFGFGGYGRYMGYGNFGGALLGSFLGGIIGLGAQRLFGGGFGGRGCNSFDGGCGGGSYYADGRDPYLQRERFRRDQYDEEQLTFQSARKRRLDADQALLSKQMDGRRRYDRDRLFS